MFTLRRITTGASWIPQVDGLRFAAILSVMVLHALLLVRDEGIRHLTFPRGTGLLTFAIENGDRGVELFFVISGYILARPFLRQYQLSGRPVSLRAYFLRRVTRLEPPYFAALLLFVGAQQIFRHASFSAIAPHLAASMLYAHNLVYKARSTINPVTWTLEIEVQFYLIAPLLGQVYRVRDANRRRWLLLGLVFCSAWISNHSGILGPWTILGFGQYFLMGFLLADLLELPRHSAMTRWRWDAMSLLAWPLLFIPRGNSATGYWLPVLLGAVFLGAFYGKAFNWFFRQPFVALTGGMCYSIYLTHILFYQLAFRVVKHLRPGGDLLNGVVQILLLVPTGLLGATFFYILIERPCMNPRWPQEAWAKLAFRG